MTPERAREVLALSHGLVPSLNMTPEEIHYVLDLVPMGTTTLAETVRQISATQDATTTKETSS